jgi:hypothetical protein
MVHAWANRMVQGPFAARMHVATKQDGSYPICRAIQGERASCRRQERVSAC